MRRLGPLAALAAVLAVPVVALAADEPTRAQIIAELARVHITPRATDHTLVVFAGSMEPTLRCAKPGNACSAAIADHVFARPVAFRALRRGMIVVVATPDLARVRCGATVILVKRV